MEPTIPRLRRRKFIQAGTTAVTLPFFNYFDAQNSEYPKVTNADSVLTVENMFFKLTFSKSNGGIIQIHSKSSNLDFRKDDDEYPATLWGLQFYHSEFGGVGSRSQDADLVSLNSKRDGDEIQVDLRWKDPTVFGLVSPETISAIIHAQVVVSKNDPLAKFSISIENNSTLAIKSVNFPLVSNIAPLAGGDDDAIILPGQMGRRIPNPIPFTDYAWEPRYPSGMATMQFTAYTSSKGGFYLDARDVDGYSKTIGWRNQKSEKDRILLKHGFDVQRQPGENVEVPYEVTIGPLDGDWHNAADRYRGWLDKEGWLSEPGFDPPEWYQNVGAVFHGKSYERPASSNERNVSFEKTISRVIEIKDRLQVPMQFSWWGYQTYGNFGYGDWFPPKEGWESFRKSIRRLENHEISLLGFVNSKMMAKASDLWKNRKSTAKNWIIRNKDQSPKKSDIQGYTRYYTEFTADGWQEHLQNALRTFVREGAREVQIDGFPWNGPPEGYANNHSHISGVGGNWYSQESRSILKQIRQELRDIDDSVLVSGEGICDFYLPYMDIQMTRDVVAEEAGNKMVVFEDAQIIPLTQYALGDHMAVRGSNHLPFVNTNWAHNAQYLRLTIARSLQWGALPLFMTDVSIPRSLENDTLLDFLAEAVWMFHLHGTRFLVDGRLLRPPKIETGDIVSTNAKINKLPDKEEMPVSSPAIVASAWESGDENERALILSNIATSTQSTEIDLSQHPFTSKNNGSKMIYTVSNGSYARPQIGSELNVKLAPREVIMVVSTPESSGKERALDTIVQAEKNSQQSQRLTQAKRAYVEGRYQKSIEIVESDHEKTTSSLNDTDKVQTSTSTQDTTNTTSPGFGIGGALGSLYGVGFGYALFDRLSSETSSDNSE